MTADSILLARSFGRLDGALAASGDPGELTPMLRRVEAVASCRIDGNQASLIDLLDAEAGLAVSGPARDVAELRALSDLSGKLPEVVAPAAWLLKTHDELMQRLGRVGTGWRSVPMWIGTSGATRAEARHVPPAPDQIPDLMLNWEQSWVKRGTISPLLELSTSLAALESIQPFTEMNARVARLWLQQSLIQMGFIRHPLLLWSGQLLRRRHEARQAIQAQRSDKDDDTWARLFASMLRQAADETTEVVCRVAALRSLHRKTIGNDFGRAVPQALRLADALCAHPMVDIKDVIALTGVTFPAANDLVRRFERAGLLVEVTGNARNRRFRYAPFVRIFLDDE
ncbi:MAG: Fic family protein [Pseudomonadota bacterium]